MTCLDSKLGGSRIFFGLFLFLVSNLSESFVCALYHSGSSLHHPIPTGTGLMLMLIFSALGFSYSELPSHYPRLHCQWDLGGREIRSCLGNSHLPWSSRSSLEVECFLAIQSRLFVILRPLISQTHPLSLLSTKTLSSGFTEPPVVVAWIFRALRAPSIGATATTIPPLTQHQNIHSFLFPLEFFYSLYLTWIHFHLKNVKTFSLFIRN